MSVSNEKKQTLWTRKQVEDLLREQRKLIAQERYPEPRSLTEERLYQVILTKTLKF